MAYQSNSNIYSGYQGQLQIVVTTVSSTGAAGSSLPVQLGGFELTGIQLPATLTSTALSFKASSVLGGPYQTLYNSSGAVSYTVAGGRFLTINPSDFAGTPFIEIVLGSAESSDKQFSLSLRG